MRSSVGVKSSPRTIMTFRKPSRDAPRSRLWAARMFISLVAMVKATFLPVWELTGARRKRGIGVHGFAGVVGYGEAVGVEREARVDVAV